MPTLQFKGKIAVEGYHHTVPHHVLEFDGKLSVLAKGERPSLSGNLIVEGDNLLALKALLPTHAGRVKCIYIDPPYNTGKEGWVFNDNLSSPQFKEWIGTVVGTEGEDASRHDKWCCMMYPRLELLKDLLRDDGLILVSIDDNEVHHLRMLMDEVFGPGACLGTIIWKNARDNNPTQVAMEHEYILVYSKNRDAVTPVWKNGAISGAKQLLLDFYEAQKKKTDSQEELESALRQFLKDNVDSVGELERYKFVDADGPFTGSESVHNPHPGGYDYDIEHPVTKKPMNKPANGYRFPPATMKRDYIDKGRLLYGPDENRIVKIKLHLKDYQDTLRSVIELDGRLGAYRLSTIFGKDNVFDNPKPIELVKRLLAFTTGGSDLVLDSFAGSGTTGHAVMELNQEDGAQRRFVLVQMPHDSREWEKSNINICEQITAERVRRVMIGNPPGKADTKVKKRKVGGSSIGGAFTYARLGEPLFADYRLFTATPPTYDELAKYVFYTETSHHMDAAAVDPKTGNIGKWADATYFLFYTPEPKQEREVDFPMLQRIAQADKSRNLVIYCEKNWIHPDDHEEFVRKTGLRVRVMTVPLALKSAQTK